MNEQNLQIENNLNIAGDRVRFGLFFSFLGLIVFVLGAKPEWFNLAALPAVGFVQVTVLLVGLAFICIGGHTGLAALWGRQEKTIAADIGSRLISTGYVISAFSGLADVFGMSVKDNPKLPFFGPWQAAGVTVGMIIIAIGVLLLIPYHHLKK